MFNPGDFFLATEFAGPGESNWEKNQLDYKPDDPPRLGQYFHLATTHAGSVSTPDHRPVTDPHESMAFIARTRTRAVGAQAGVGGAISQEVNLGEGTDYDFRGSRSDHSAEFNRRIQQLDPFYRFVFQNVR